MFDKELYRDLFVYYLDVEKLPVQTAFDKILIKVEQEIREIKEAVWNRDRKTPKKVIPFLSHEVETVIPTELFIRFMKQYKKIYELFLEILEPYYMDNLTIRVQRGEHVLEKPGIIPKLDKFLDRKRYYGNEAEKRACETYVPVLSKIREIIERFTEEIYKECYISERSIYKVSEVAGAIYYHLFWDHRLILGSPYQSGIQYYLNITNHSFGQTTIYLYKDKALTGILSRLEKELKEDQLEALNELIQFADQNYVLYDGLSKLIDQFEEINHFDPFT